MNWWEVDRSLVDCLDSHNVSFPLNQCTYDGELVVVIGKPKLAQNLTWRDYPITRKLPDPARNTLPPRNTLPFPVHPVFPTITWQLYSFNSACLDHHLQSVDRNRTLANTSPAALNSDVFWRTTDIW